MYLPLSLSTLYISFLLSLSEVADHGKGLCKRVKATTIFTATVTMTTTTTITTTGTITTILTTPILPRPIATTTPKKRKQQKDNHDNTNKTNTHNNNNTTANNRMVLYMMHYTSFVLVDHRFCCPTSRMPNKGIRNANASPCETSTTNNDILLLPLLLPTADHCCYRHRKPYRYRNQS